MTIFRTILACLALAASLYAQRATVTLLATTDLHGNIYPYDYYTARPAERGLAKIATLVREARREAPEALLIDVGDTIQGTPLESLHQSWVRTGKLPLGLKSGQAAPPADPMMVAMNAMRYEAMVLGNHEFNFGLKNLEKARGGARFPWLSANTEGAPPGGKPFAPYIVKTVSGVKVAVFGITTPSIPSWEQPQNYRGLRFRPGVEAAREVVEELRRRERPDLIVAAVHAGLGRDGENMVTAIAEQVAGIDAIVYGHSHQRQAGTRIGEVLLVQPQNWGASLARLDFDFEKEGSGWRVASKRSQLIPVTSATAADPEILSLAKPYHELAERYLETTVAESPADLEASRGRIEDTALVDAVHEVQLHYAKAEVSFTALFNPQVRVPKGRVTVRQIAALYVYDNELYAVEGTGRMVKDALENAARFFLTCREAACTTGPLIDRDVPGYNYDMAQGVSYEVDLTRPAGERIRNLTYKGRPLRPEQRLRIAINNYRAGGSGGYRMFRDAKVVWRSSEDLRSLVVDYFIERGRLPGAPDGNWRVVPEGAKRTLEREVSRAR